MQSLASARWTSAAKRLQDIDLGRKGVNKKDAQVGSPLLRQKKEASCSDLLGVFLEAAACAAFWLLEEERVASKKERKFGHTSSLLRSAALLCVPRE